MTIGVVRQKNMVMSPTRPETKNDCAGEDQQQFNRPNGSQLMFLRNISPSECKSNPSKKRAWCKKQAERSLPIEDNYCDVHAIGQQSTVRRLFTAVAMQRNNGSDQRFLCGPFR
jgi:hypothetical protein